MVRYKHLQKAHAILLDPVRSGHSQAGSRWMRKGHWTGLTWDDHHALKESPWAEDVLTVGSLLRWHIQAGMIIVKIYLRAVFLHSSLACLGLWAGTHRRKMIMNAKRHPLSPHLSSPPHTLLWSRTPSVCRLPFETSAVLAELGSGGFLTAFHFPHTAVWHVQTKEEFPLFCWQVRH